MARKECLDACLAEANELVRWEKEEDVE
jgi:hypothetical protein